MPALNIILIVIISILSLLLVIVAVGAYFFFDYSIKRKEPQENPTYLKDPTNPWTIMKNKMDKGKEWINSHDLEMVEIKSYDGLRLVGYILPAEVKTDKTILMMHGYHSQDFNDFSCSAQYFHELGYNLLLADQRCHGKSEGKYITFGIKERYDCRDWVNFIVKRFGENSTIFLMGVSMGCATVTMALGFDLPKNVKGCISDCGFTSPFDIFKHVVKRDFHLPPFPFVYLQDLVCKKVAGFSIYEYSTLDAMKTNKIPILFIHGAKDDFVPVWMTKKNFEACKAPKELLIADNAEHAMSFLRAPEKCWKKIKAFVQKYE